MSRGLGDVYKRQIKNKPKSVEELTRENEQLREKNESLSGQVTDLQLALCDVYEMIEATVYGAE